MVGLWRCSVNWTGTTTVLVPKSEVKPTENLEEKLALQVGLPILRKSCLGYVVTRKSQIFETFPSD